MKDGRIFYIEMEGYDQQPELSILIGVDIFVNENGRILAKIPNKNIRNIQQNMTHKEDRAELEVTITKSEINENKEFDFTIIAKNNGKEDAEETKVKMKLPNGYRFIKAEGFLTNEDLVKWRETGDWKIGILGANKEKQLVIKVQLVEDLTKPRIYTFLAEISSQTQEATFQNNNMKIGNRIFVVKTIQRNFDTGAPSAGITNKERRATEKFIKDNKDNPNAFTSDCIAYQNCIEIIAEKAIRLEMARIVEQDCEESPENNNKEFGGVVYRDGRVQESFAKDEDKDPSKDKYITIQLPFINKNILTRFHSHPSAGFFGKRENNEIPGGRVLFRSSDYEPKWAKAPSFDIIDQRTGNQIGDIKSIKNDEFKEEIRYVFSRRDEGIVFMYNINGVLATLPHKIFKNL